MTIAGLFYLVFFTIKELMKPRSHTCLSVNLYFTSSIALVKVDVTVYLSLKLLEY
jgi:hypothetical protein